MNGSAGYEEILRTYNPIDIALVKSLLDRERIAYFFRDALPRPVVPAEGAKQEVVRLPRNRRVDVRGDPGGMPDEPGGESGGGDGGCA